MAEALPSYLAGGEVARLFPVVSEGSRETRNNSVLMATLMAVDGFGGALLNAVGQKTGKRSRVRCFTEVRFKNSPLADNARPDGLIVLSTGNREWTALVETKIGRAELDRDQLDTSKNLAILGGK